MDKKEIKSFMKGEESREKHHAKTEALRKKKGMGAGKDGKSPFYSRGEHGGLQR
jgi:hypothetical protein